MGEVRGLLKVKCTGIELFDFWYRLCTSNPYPTPSLSFPIKRRAA
jgi:hypothetical protein